MSPKKTPLSSRLRTFVLVITPLVAVALLILGLRIGAKGSVRAATVWGAPPAGGSRLLAWQIVTYLDDRGVRESVPVKTLTVTARLGGETATWTGDTNGDGVAEPLLTLSGLTSTSKVYVEVTTPSEALPLAEGWVDVPGSDGWGPGEGAVAAPIRATRRDGPLVVDLFVTDERLIVGYAVPVVARVVSRETGKPVDGASLIADPEPGLLATPFTRTCKDGYAFAEMNAGFHVLNLTLRARTEDGKEGRLFAVLPVAHGANFVDAVRELGGSSSFPVTVRAPGMRTVAYAEIDDARGRAFATTLQLVPEPSGPAASFLAPPLPPGIYWIVTSGDPRGAERIEGSTIARTLRVGRSPSADPAAGCKERADLSMHPGSGFRRTELLDGLHARRRDDRKRERVGLGVALLGLLAAAVLEALLALQAVREARELIENAVREVEGEAAVQVTKRGTSAGSVLVGLCVVVLGFALLAALLVWKA